MSTAWITPWRPSGLSLTPYITAVSGLPGWWAKSAGAVLHTYGHLEAIPRLADRWVPTVRGAAKLANTLAENFEAALLFRKLATLVTELPVGTVDDWQWRGPTDDWPAVCEKLGDRRLAARAQNR